MSIDVKEGLRSINGRPQDACEQVRGMLDRAFYSAVERSLEGAEPTERIITARHRRLTESAMNDPVNLSFRVIIRAARTGGALIDPRIDPHHAIADLLIGCGAAEAYPYWDGERPADVHERDWAERRRNWNGDIIADLTHPDAPSTCRAVRRIRSRHF